MFRFLAATVDVVHAAMMVGWALGFPLLFWRRWPAATRLYSWFAILFVVVSQGSHYLLGECVLTTLARQLRELAGVAALEREPFTLQLVDFVAGVRPTARNVVLVWEIAMVLTSLALLWHLHASQRPPRAGGQSRRFG